MGVSPDSPVFGFLPFSESRLVQKAGKGKRGALAKLGIQERQPTFATTSHGFD